MNNEQLTMNKIKGFRVWGSGAVVREQIVRYQDEPLNKKNRTRNPIPGILATVLFSLFLFSCEGFGGSLADWHKKALEKNGENGGGYVKHTHSWGDWITITEATCTSASLQERYCNQCDEVQTQSIGAALGHIFVAGTCTRCSQLSQFASTSGVDLVYINPGTFTMGSPTSEVNRYSDETQHQVTITKGFYIGKYVVTQEQYQAVTGTNPSYFTIANGKSPESGEVDAGRPVECVTWYDAIEFCNKLSAREGLTAAYTISNRKPESGYPIINATVIVNWGVNGYRLPTEAEWEYACRAGTITAYNTGDIISDDTGWYSNNSESKTHEVGKKPANAWGLHDMHGNVWEWCWDRYENYSSDARTDPRGAASGSDRVKRGGSWDDVERFIRSAFRSNCDANGRSSCFGFRLLRPDVGIPDTSPVITITTQPVTPDSGTLIVGNITGSMEVEATISTGSTINGYQWYKANNSTSNEDGTAISGATSAGYSILNTSEAGTYYYFCEVRGSNGAVSVRTNVVTVVVALYLVTFNSNGGTEVAPVAVTISGSTIIVPTAPTKGSYGTFGGWFKDGSFVNLWNFTTDTVAGNITLYAKWVAAYTIGSTGPAGGKIFYVNPDGFTVEAFTGAGFPEYSGTFASYTAYYLEAAAADESSSAEWGMYGTLIPSATGITTFTSSSHADASKIGNGRKDTQIIVNFLGTSENGRAAQLCANKSNSFTDWFLPSLGELIELYKAREAVEMASSGYFWSSSQYDNYCAWTQDFAIGIQGYGNEASNYNVRAVRAF